MSYAVESCSAPNASDHKIITRTEFRERRQSVTTSARITSEPDPKPGERRPELRAVGRPTPVGGVLDEVDPAADGPETPTLGAGVAVVAGRTDEELQRDPWARTPRPITPVNATLPHRTCLDGGEGKCD